MRVLLIRHGVTDWNIERRWQGVVDVPLNDEGRRQAQLLADHLKAHSIDAIYSSDLARAWDTAVVIGQGVGVPPQADQRLRETNAGVFQGLTGDEVNRRYPRELAQFNSNYMDFVIPNGESQRQVQTRAYAAFQEIVARGGKEIALVSHGGTIRMLLRKLVADEEMISVTHITNTSITTLEQRDAAWHLIEISATPHLIAVDGHRRQVDSAAKPL